MRVGALNSKARKCEIVVHCVVARVTQALRILSRVGWAATASQALLRAPPAMGAIMDHHPDSLFLLVVEPVLPGTVVQLGHTTQRRACVLLDSTPSQRLRLARCAHLGSMDPPRSFPRRCAQGRALLGMNVPLDPRQGR